MLPIHTMVISLTIFCLCFSVISAQSMSQFIWNMVSQPNLDPYTKNFLKTSVAQEMFDIEMPPQTTPPPEGQFGKPGGEASQMLGMPPSSETVFASSPPRNWNGAPNEPPQNEIRRNSEAVGSWSEGPQQQGSNVGQQSEQILVKPPNEAGNSPFFRDAFESHQARFMSNNFQSMPTMSNWEIYPMRPNMNMLHRTNEFSHPMEYRNYNFQGNSRGNYLNQEYLPRNGQYQSQGSSLPIYNYQSQGNNQPNYQNQGTNQPNYQNQGSNPPNDQTSNAPNYQNQRNVPANYQGQNAIPDNSAGVSQNQDNAPRNAPMNNQEIFQNYENNPVNFPISRNIVNSQSNAVPKMLQRNTGSKGQVETPTTAPLPNTMPDNIPLASAPARSEAVGNSAGQRMATGREANAQETGSSFRFNPTRDNPMAYQMGYNNERNGPMAIPRYPNEPSSGFLPQFSSMQEPFMGPNQAQSGSGPQIPLARNIIGTGYSMPPFIVNANPKFPAELFYYHQPSGQSLGVFPFGFERLSTMQATPPPHLASFAAMRMPSPQDMLKSGQVVVPRTVPSPYMMDKMMAMAGFEGVEVV